MKLVSYLKAGEIQLGAIVNESLYNLQSVNENLPKNIIDFFQSSNEIIQQTIVQYKQLEHLEILYVRRPSENFQTMFHGTLLKQI